MLSTDESWRGGADHFCDCCGRPGRRTWSMVVRDGAFHALYFAACYDHGDVRESWIDVTFGGFGEVAGFEEHVTFGCRFGPVDDDSEPGLTLVDAVTMAPDAMIFGQRLKREQALVHPRIGDFWDVVRFVVETDPLVYHHHFGQWRQGD